ncbi:MAG: hypothetical protein OXC72_03980 [Roseovarius sp.]|nr:hypothetical protein [Roseovarius sp.]MCY4290904.1 hypothetical protein [Roseovarius sp.]
MSLSAAAGARPALDAQGPHDEVFARWAVAPRYGKLPWFKAAWRD